MPKKEERDRMLEGIIAKYKVASTGAMQRIEEVPLRMGGNFYKSKDGNMTLVRSRDKRLISVVNFERNSDQGKHFKVLAFTTKLKVFPIADELNEGLNQYYKGVMDSFESIVEISFVGKSQYLQMVYMEKQSRPIAEQMDFGADAERKRSMREPSQRS